MSEKIRVQNCRVDKTFDVDIKYPLFPIRGYGIVSLEYCGSCTDPKEDARLVTNEERTVLFCKALFCGNHLVEDT